MSASRTARRLAAAVLASGAVVASIAMPASADDGRDRGRHYDRRSAVALGHIQYNSPGRDDYSNRSLNAEWVDVTNTGRRSVDLEGWTLTARDGKRYTFEDVRLAGHSTIRVHTGVGRDTRRDVYQDRRSYVWDNWSDRATLRDEDGDTVDTASWGRRHSDRHHGDHNDVDYNDRDRDRHHGQRRHSDDNDRDRHHGQRRHSDDNDRDRHHGQRRHSDDNHRDRHHGQRRHSDRP
ncbi:lamin tail domain-containing protein [Streptomyces sp. NPDC002889]|uniref:lamin tail domain-containing protein n=1 Tax=Streptomyces sp. NPDC002889 TaxID=3364669 RepID=UPI0036C1850B